MKANCDVTSWFYWKNNAIIVCFSLQCCPRTGNLLVTVWWLVSGKWWLCPGSGDFKRGVLTTIVAPLNLRVQGWKFCWRWVLTVSTT